jgi:thiol-disulfide isomerase/thioredoxin
VDVPMKYFAWILGLISYVPFQSGAQVRSDTSRRVVIPLERAVDDRPAPYFSGQTNIFFSPVPEAAVDSVIMGKGWIRPELADVIDHAALQKVRVLRYATEGDTTRRYVLDTAGTLDFTKGILLNFERIGELMVAKVPLRIRAAGGQEVTVPLQVMYAGKYSYARIAEMRIGTAEIGNRKYAVRVQPRSRNHPFYTITGGTRFLIDFDADGVFSTGTSRLVNGRPVASEEYQPDAPFAVSGMWYDVESIDSLGSKLVLRPTTKTTAVAAGFKPPQFVALDLAGRTVTLSTRQRKPILLEFWSTECPYSEAIRDSLNALYSNRNGQFAWIAMSRETDGATVGEFMRSKPRLAQVVLADTATWNRFNPSTVTPLFILLDPQGTIAYVTLDLTRFRGRLTRPNFGAEVAHGIEQEGSPA